MARFGRIAGLGLELSLGTGCLFGNPAFGDEATASGGASETGAGATGTTSGATGGVTSSSGTGGSGTGDASTGEASTSTGEASTGGSSTGGPFCNPTQQARELCAPLADTGLLVCEALTTWGKAKLACEEMCGQLAVIPESEVRLAVYEALRARMTADDLAKEALIEQQMMGDQPSEPRASAWLGASAAGPNLDYVWLDGTVLPAVQGTNGWGPNDPDYSGLCLALGIWGKGADDGDFFDRTCDVDTYLYLCETG